MATSDRHAALSISLPKPLRRFVDQRVRSGGFGNLSEYVRSLIRTDQQSGGAAAKPAPLPPMRGVGVTPASSPPVAVREGSPATGMSVVDFTADDWRELREALATGERRMMAQRLAETADLWKSVLTIRRAVLRRDFPEATEEEIDMRFASWLREQTQEPEDPYLVPASPERVQRILHG